MLEQIATRSEEEPEPLRVTIRTARVAGALYLLSSLTGFFSFMIVPTTLIVQGNATATANNILAS